MSRRFLNNCLFSTDRAFDKAKRFLSAETQYDYQNGIRKMVRELHAAGYQLSNIKHLKAKHVDFLITQWKENGISNAAIKNRLSQVRYLSQMIDKPDLLPKSNDALNIGKRSYIPTESKAIHEIDVNKFENPLIRYSVQLQQQFGLRRQEAIKFVVSYADLGDRIRLKPSWTKGGVGRDVPITTLEQRALLDELKANFGAGKALIPDGHDYAYQKRVYDEAVIKAGYSNLHGLRHGYAQRRYFEITNQHSDGKGWHAPFNSGQHRKDLPADRREVDDEARRIISRELGHARAQISATYLGN